MTTPAGQNCSILTSIFQSLSQISSQIPPRGEDDTSQFKTIIQSLPEPTQANLKSILLTLHFIFPHDFLPALDILDRRLITQFVLEKNNHVASNPDPFLNIDSNKTPEKQQDAKEHAGPKTDQDQEQDESRPEDSNIFIHIDTSPSLKPTTTRLQSNPLTDHTYYVQSVSSVINSTSSTTTTSSRTTRKIFNPTQIHYLVRLDSWNCTCPSFAVSSMAMITENLERSGVESETLANGGDYPFTNTGLSGEEEGRNVNVKMDLGWEMGGTITNTGHPVPICKHVLATVLALTAENLFPAAITTKLVPKDELVGWAAGWGEYG